MRLQQAIKQKYGISLGYLGGEGIYRTFPIDQLRNGFVIPMREGGVFGCFIDGEAWICAKGSVEFCKIEHRENKDISKEWLIWHSGKAMIDSGEDLSAVDQERLALAVKRLEDLL